MDTAQNHPEFAAVLPVIGYVVLSDPLINNSWLNLKNRGEGTWIDKSNMIFLDDITGNFKKNFD